jgi:hypothetical protein
MNRAVKAIAVGVGTIIMLAALVYVLGGATNPASTENTYAASLYDPVRGNEELPQGFRQVLGRDAIRPIYEPTFVAAEDAGWSDSTLVVALEIDGDARAYPVSHLNRREIVNDHIGNTPVLVTW